MILKKMVTPGLTVQQHRAHGLSFGDSAAWMMLTIIGTILVFYWPSFVWLGGEWSSTSGVFSHGYLVAGICSFLIIRAMRTLGPNTLSPSWRVFPLLIILSLVWSFGNAANVVVVQTMVLPPIVLASVWSAFGRRAVGAISFAVLFVYFAMPAWTHIQFIFQYITTAIVHFFIRIVDIPVYVEGNLVHVPAGIFEIAGGCSGIGFILVATCLTTLYGHLYYVDRYKQLVLIFVSLLIAMMINWIRVSIIVVIGNATNMQHPLIADHLTLGWVLFAIAMLPLYYVAYRLQPELNPNESQEIRPRSNNDKSETKIILASTVLVVVTLAAAPVWINSLRSGYAEQEPVRLVLPPVSGNWSGPDNTTYEWSPRFFGASAEVIGEYRLGESSIWAYANIYQTQSQSRELIYFKNSVVGELHESRRSVREINSDGSSPVRVIEVEANGVTGRWVIWYWYEINGWKVTGSVNAKLMQALSFILGRPASGAIALAAPCRQDCASATTRLQNFVASAATGLHLSNIVSVESH